MKYHLQEPTKGTLVMGFTFFLWGFFTIYFSWLGEVNPFEVLAHRIIWSMLLLTAWLVYSKRWYTTLSYMRHIKMAIQLFIAAIFIACNWLVFIYAMGVGQILQTSIGYYTAPFVTIALGVIFLKERLNIRQMLSLIIIFIALGYQWLQVEGVPFIALALSFSFSFYTLCKKTITIKSDESLFIETLLLTPLAFLMLIYISQYEMLTFGTAGKALMTFLLLISGVVTAIPLLLMGYGLKKIPLYLAGFLQYITPTVSFAIAIIVYDEPLNMTKLYTFILIWIALAIFIYDGYVRILTRKSHV